MAFSIGIDIDGTLVNTPMALCEYISERIPVKITLDDLTTYWVEDLLPTQYQWIVEAAFKDSCFWKRVKMLPTAEYWVKQLYLDRHELWFVTSSLPQNLRKKINHLSRNLPFLPEGYVESHTINLRRKQMLKLDIMVDDAEFNLTGERDYFSICLAYPYNKTIAKERNAVRVHSWAGVYNAVVEYQLEKGRI